MPDLVSLGKHVDKNAYKKEKGFIFIMEKEKSQFQLIRFIQIYFYSQITFSSQVMNLLSKNNNL